MIRSMITDDSDAVFELWANTADMGLRSLDDSREGVNTFLKRNPKTCFVALDGSTVVGSILCGHDGRRGYIYHTVVRDEYRGRGIGSALVDATVAALQREGITRVCLNVMERSDAGKRFWINRGWEKKEFLGFYSRSITDRKNVPLFEVEK